MDEPATAPMPGCRTPIRSKDGQRVMNSGYLGLYPAESETQIAITAFDKELSECFGSNSEVWESSIETCMIKSICLFDGCPRPTRHCISHFAVTTLGALNKWYHTLLVVQTGITV